MKTIKILFLMLATMLVFSNMKCTKKKIQLDKTIDGASATFILLPQGAGAFDYSDVEQFDLEAELQTFGLSTSNVVKAKASEITITIIDTTSSPVTFDMVDSATLEMGSTNIPMHRVAFKTPVPKTGSTTLKPDLDTGIDPTELLKVKSINYHYFGRLNKALDHSIKMRVDFKWTVTTQI
jgi:hypothetical protein